MTHQHPLRRIALITSTALAGSLLATSPVLAQSLPDTGNLTTTTAGLSGGSPGSTNPAISTTGAAGAQTMQIGLRDNRTIMTWGGAGFNIAAGNTVDFKDARATSGVTGRTDNIAVLNRDLSGSKSSILGSLHSDPNVAVYLINRNGIYFGASSAVDTGSLWGSTLDISNDSDFLNGVTTLRFAGPEAQIVMDTNASIKTTATSSTNGGRIGDLVLLGQNIETNYTVKLNADGGDVGLVVAADVTVQASAGSPLSFAINQASTYGALGSLFIDGNISGRNVTLAMSHDAPDIRFGTLYVNGSITATGAAQTDHGVVLSYDTPAPGVSYASGLPASGYVVTQTRGGNITSAKDIYFATSGDVILQNPMLNASGLIYLHSMKTGGGFLGGFTNTELKGGSVSIGLQGTYMGKITSTSGDVTIAVDDMEVYGGLDVARDLYVNSKIFSAATPVSVGRDVFANTSQLQSWGMGATIGRNASFIDTGLDAFSAPGLITWGRDLSVTGDLYVKSANRIDVEPGNLPVAGLTSAGGTVHFEAGTNLTLNSDITAGGGIDLYSASTTITVADVLSTPGNVTLRTGLGNLIIGSTGRISGHDVVLSTPSVFSNQAGTSAITATGRWLIYSDNPSAFGPGGLDSHNTALWNSTYATRDPSTVTGNRYVFAYQPTLSVASVDFSKVYGTDLTLANAVIPFTVSAYQPGVAGAYLADTATTAYAGTPLITSAGFAQRASVAGGPYTTSVAQGSLVSNAGYAFSFSSPGKVTVTPKAVTGTVTVNNKTYDGTTAATGTVGLNGVVSGDAVHAAGTVFTFVDKNAGTMKTVTVTGTYLKGADAGNYTLTIPSSVVADIFKKAVTGTVAVDTKTYDGTAAATGSVSLSGVIGSDNVNAKNVVLAFADKNAGTGKTVTVSGGRLAGLDAGNYTLVLPATALGTILKKALGATITVNTKVYDGTTAATGSIALSGVIAGDSVNGKNLILTFLDANPGRGKTVTVGGARLAGLDAGNYTLVLPATVLGDILSQF